MDLFKGSIPQDDQIMNLPLDTDRTRGDDPVRNPLELTGMTGPGPRSLLQREVSTVAKGSRAQIVLTEPRRCPVPGLEVEGTVTDTRANIPYQCCDCGIRMATGHKSVTTEDKGKDPGPIRTYPVKTEYAPIGGETVILRPMNLLDVPALRLPGVFLKLAEEARKSEVMDDQQSRMSAVKLHRSGQTGRVMITEITDSFPVLGSGASRASQTSTEVIPDLNLVEPVIRLGPVGHLRNTEQPVMLRVKTNQGTISPPGPVGQHVLMAGHMEMMVQRDPVGPYEETEPSVSQGMISPPGPVGQHVLMAGHMEMVVQPDPVVPYEETEPSVSPGFDVGQVEHLPSSQVLPGVEMSHIQPVADGPAGLVRTRHPAGTVMPPAIQDGVRLLAGGLVCRFPDPRFHISSKDSSPDNSYQLINDTLNNVMMGNRARMISHDIPWGEDNGQVQATCASVYISPIRVRGRFGCLGRPVQGADWLDVRPVDVGTAIWIKYIGDSFSRYQSSDAAPLTEVQDIYITLHFNTECFAGLCSTRIVSFSVRITGSLEEVIRCGGVLSLCQTMDGAALADDRSGITFTADLCVQWDAPEAVVDMDSTDLISLGPFPDKVGLVGRRKDAAMSHIMKGRDCRSVRFVVPDVHLVDSGFHDVTVVDMGDDREPTIVLQDMTRLRELWPVEVFDQMKSRQQDLELMRKSAKRNYQQVRPMPCRFCGKVIRVDMYRHVARLHLDLVQLWRCPIAWCTTWKGSPQDCLEHVRSGHDAPWVEKTASIERYAPPWTVSRQLWMDSLRIEHSGISTDMLLFSEVGMPLTQHYRVYKGGLPHAVFRTDYLPRLRALLPSPGGTEDPSVIGYGSTPTSVRRQRRMSRPTRLFPDSAADVPILMEQHPAAMVGKTVIDCRPSILPVSIPFSGLSPETISEARNCVSYQQLEESGRSIMNMDTNEISIDRIVGFAWNDGGTDVEDELPSPVLSPVRIVSPSITPAGSADPFGGVENFDIDLAKVLCDVSVLPSLVTPLVDEEAAVGGTVADYAPPAAPAIETVESSPFVPDSAADTSLDGGFLQLLREPREPLTVTPPVSPMVADNSTPTEGPDSQRETLPIPSISPILPTGAVHADTGPDLSREGPFNAYDVVPDAGQSPVVMDSMTGCQYRMTSYEERVTDSDMNPSYGIHMHDPRVIEYMGAPESARLMGRTPEYWLQHMGRERTIQAALRLHHDASLIMTNIQIMSQLATSFSRAASEVMRTIHDREPFPTEAVDLVTPGRQVRRAAHYVAAMGLWRPTSAPVFPGPVSASSCNSCMACDDCFPDGGK